MPCELISKIDLLNNSTSVRELKIKHFKILLKTLLGDEPDIEAVYTNLINVLIEITDYDALEISNLSIIDFLILVINIRCMSIGGSVQLEVKDSKNTKISLNLLKIIETLKDIFILNPKQTIDDITVELQTVSVKDFLFNDDFNNPLILKNFIKTITLPCQLKIDISKLDNKTFLHLFNSLPVNYSVKIFKLFTEHYKNINEINLLHHLRNDDFSLLLNRETFTFIMQILFSKNLMPLYENIFALSKFANLSPEYIEECTPGEYTLYVKLLEQVFKEQAPKQTQLPPINQSMPNFM